MAIFFCLSAYLIVTLLLREREQTGNVRLGAFAMRRALRIWPLYFPLIAICWFFGHLWPQIRLEHHFLLALVLMCGNIYIARYGWQRAGASNPLWSISVEEQFYLAVPLVVRFGGRVAIVVLSMLTLLISYGTLYMLRWKIPVWQVWANSFVQFQFFAAGALIAAFGYRRKVRLSVPGRLALMTIGIALLLAAALFGLHSIHPIGGLRLLSGYAAELAGIFAIFIATLHFPLSPNNPLTYLGKISYGLYMFHFPLLWLSSHFLGIDTSSLARQILLQAGVLLTTIGISALSYHFYERPILRLKRRFEVVKTRPA